MFLYDLTNTCLLPKYSISCTTSSTSIQSPSTVFNLFQRSFLLFLVFPHPFFPVLVVVMQTSYTSFIEEDNRALIICYSRAAERLDLGNYTVVVEGGER
jgi:hypothetical protein